MLEHSKTTMAEADPTQRQAAEIIARAFLSSELQENLIPADQADVTADDHRATGSETWRRAVHSALTGLRAASEQGFHLAKPIAS